MLHLEKQYVNSRHLKTTILLKIAFFFCVFIAKWYKNVIDVI